MIEDTIVERTPHKAQLEKGVYNAIIKRVEAQKDVQTSYGIRDMIVLTYDVDGIEIRRRYNKSWNAGSALFKLVSDLRPDEVLSMKFDVAELEGTKVRVMISRDNIMEVELPPKAKPIEPLATKAARSFEDDAEDENL
jgi:hypothetical protein